MRERVPTPLVVAHQRVVVEREGWRCFQDSREHDYLRAFCLELAWDRRHLLQSLEEGSHSRLIASSFVFDEENPVLSHPHACIFCDSRGFLGSSSCPLLLLDISSTC